MEAAFLTLSPSAWVVGVAATTLVLTNAATGRGMLGLLRSTLELPLFVVVSRLVYGMYLIHVPLMFWWMAFWTHQVQYNFMTLALPYIGFVSMSLASAAGLYLLVSSRGRRGGVA